MISKLKGILLVTFLTFSYQGFAQDYFKSKRNLSTFELRGEVKDVTTFIHMAKLKRNGSIRKGSRISNSQEQLAYYEKMEFNKDKDLTKVTNRFNVGRMITSTKYNEHLDIDEIKINTYFKEANNRSKYIYDEDNDLKEVIVYGFKDSILHRTNLFYHKDENILETKTVQNAIPVKIYEQFNDYGNIEKSIKFNQNDELLETIAYQYDSNNRLTAKTVYDSGSEFKNSEVFEYNDEGFLSTITTTFGQDSEPIILGFIYKYDSVGNWIERISYKNDHPEVIHLRKIAYYK